MSNKKSKFCNVFFNCNVPECPAFNSAEQPCWTIVGTLGKRKLAAQDDQCSMSSFLKDGCRSCDYYLMMNDTQLKHRTA